MLDSEWQGTAEDGATAAGGYWIVWRQASGNSGAVCIDSEGQRLCVNLVTTASM